MDWSAGFYSFNKVNSYGTSPIVRKVIITRDPYKPSIHGLLSE